MEASKRGFCLTMTVCLTAILAQESQQSTTTDLHFLETTETPTELPIDNGMSVGDIPEPATPVLFPSSPEKKEEEPSAVEEQPNVAFPENHKNFTPSQYLGGEEFPPYFNRLSPYQQQYKNYFEQKQIYNKKPIKFESDSLKTFYLPPQPLGDEKKSDFRVTRTPFPYAFEKGDNENWHSNAGHQSLPQHEFRGHQDFVPYLVYPEEQKYYKNDLVHFDREVTKEEKENPWKKVFHVLSALVPLGLLLATLTPNVISINSTTPAKTIKQRSEDSNQIRFKEEDVMKLMTKYGIDSIKEAQCEDRIICELAREGMRNSAGPIERGFWFLANQTPWDLAEKSGMKDLFKTIKSGNCEVYKCRSKTKSTRGKKLVRIHPLSRMGTK